MAEEKISWLEKRISSPMKKLEDKHHDYSQTIKMNLMKKICLTLKE